jgi:histidinol-phosphate/aromatic aminotransferase/cobyric acid decarboxylase-like protein
MRTFSNGPASLECAPATPSFLRAWQNSSEGKDPYNPTVTAEQAILASLDDVLALLKTVELIKAERDRMHGKLAPCPAGPSRPAQTSSSEVRARRQDVREQLRQEVSRALLTPGLRNCIRVSVWPAEHTDRPLRR